MRWLVDWFWCFPVVACFPKGEYCFPNISSSSFFITLHDLWDFLLWHCNIILFCDFKGCGLKCYRNNIEMSVRESVPCNLISGIVTSSAFLACIYKSPLGIWIEKLFSWKKTTPQKVFRREINGYRWFFLLRFEYVVSAAACKLPRGTSVDILSVLWTTLKHL